MKDSLNYVFEEISKLKEQTQETEIKFWFVFIVSLLAIVIPFFQNLHKNKTDKLDKLIDDIEKTKTELEQLYIDNITDITIINSKIERLLSKYDNACYNYYKCNVWRKSFRTKLNVEIIQIVEKYKSKHEGLSTYQNSTKYYREYHQQQ